MAVAMDNAILENILRQVRPLIGQGKVADYIPALATVDGSRLGIAICTVDGQLFQAGDAQERFSIQSISKVLSLVVAMRHYSEEEIWQRVGKDPSGSPFNSLVQLEMEQGIPRKYRCAGGLRYVARATKRTTATYAGSRARLKRCV